MTTARLLVRMTDLPDAVEAHIVNRVPDSRLILAANETIGQAALTALTGMALEDPDQQRQLVLALVKNPAVAVSSLADSTVLALIDALDATDVVAAPDYHATCALLFRRRGLVAGILEGTSTGLGFLAAVAQPGTAQHRHGIGARLEAAAQRGAAHAGSAAQALQYAGWCHTEPRYRASNLVGIPGRDIRGRDLRAAFRCVHQWLRSQVGNGHLALGTWWLSALDMAYNPTLSTTQQAQLRLLLRPRYLTTNYMHLAPWSTPTQLPSAQHYGITDGRLAHVEKVAGGLDGVSEWAVALELLAAGFANDDAGAFVSTVRRVGA